MTLVTSFFVINLLIVLKSTELCFGNSVDNLALPGVVSKICVTLLPSLSKTSTLILTLA